MIFEKLTQISETELAQLFTDFENVMHSKTFKKGDILHKEGTVCNDIYFVEKGILRTFYFIASFIGITQETLSRIHAQVL